MAYIGKSPDGTGVRSRFYYTQTSGGGTSVTGSSDDGTSLAFSDGAYVDVFLNGVLLVAGTDYNTTTTNTIAGLAALANGDVIEVVVYDIFTVADTVSALNGGTFSNSVTIDKDGGTVLTVDRATSGGTIIDVQKNGSSVGTIAEKDGEITIGSGDVGLRFYAAGDAVIPVTSTNQEVRDNAIDLGGSSFRFNDAYLGGGAYIGGTGAANYLDDVEEGTFTATLNGGTGHPSTRLTTTGYYTKVNQMVHIGINFNNVTTTSYSGQISVFGLPFACGEPGRQVFTVGSYYIASFTSGVGNIFGHLSVGGTEITLLGILSGDTWTAINHSVGSSRYLQINGVYRSA